jgi:transposase
MKQIKKPYYSLEFKQDAAQLVISKGYSYSEASTSLGVSVSGLRKWVNAEKGIIKNNDKTNLQLTLSEREELQQLRKENARLKMEREILKKASAFFAQEMK